MENAGDCVKIDSADLRNHTLNGSCAKCGKGKRLTYPVGSKVTRFIIIVFSFVLVL